MTQEEVNLIYEYLHENYKYEDGELIRNKNIGKFKKGTSLGSMFCSSNCKPNLHTSITLNKKCYRMPLAHAIYLYHHKVKPRYILYKDGNVLNCSIENIAISTMSRRAQKSRIGQGFYLDARRSNPVFVAQITVNQKNIYLGSYQSENDARNAYLAAKAQYAKNS